MKTGNSGEGWGLTSVFGEIGRALKRLLYGAPKQVREDNRGTHREVPLTGHVTEDMNALQEMMGKSDDLVVRWIRFRKTKMALAFCDGLTNKEIIDRDIIKALAVDAQVREGAGFPISVAIQRLEQEGLLTSEIKEVDSINDAVDAILDGDTAVFAQGWRRAIIADTRGWEKRPVSEPEIEAVIRGPREGFTENIRTNTALVRRRLKTANLRFESMRLGTLTRTQVVIAYIENLTPKYLVDEVRKRLSMIKIDGILESGYIEELIEDHPFSIFPTVANTERPDRVAAALLQGRVAVFTDGTPIALVVPMSFAIFLCAAEDYYNRWPVVIGTRVFRYLSLFMSTFLPALYVALTTFHQELMPTTLAVAVAQQREPVPYPAIVEAMIMMITFEIMIEAGVRLPRPLGQAISIVGALVIGEAAVRAGLVSEAMVIVISLTAISSFAIPSSPLVMASRIIRIPATILAAILGIFGVLVGLLAIVIQLVTLKSFGVPFMEPMAPFIPSEEKDVVLRVPWWAMITRPELVGYRNLRRMKPGMNSRDLSIERVESGRGEDILTRMPKRHKVKPKHTAKKPDGGKTK